MKPKNIMENIILTIAALLLVAMLILVLIQIVSRYVSENPVAQTDELSRYAMIWAALLGAALGIRHKSHVAVTLVFDKLPLKYRKIAAYIVDFLTACFCILLIWQGISLVFISMQQYSTTLAVKMGYIVVIIPLLGLLGLIFVIKNIIENKEK